jgi:twitching motility protein PilT
VPKIDPLLDDVVKRGASDLHLAPGAPPMGRIRGDLVPLIDLAIDASEVEKMLVELLQPSQRARLAADLDLDFSYDHKDVARFRVSYFHDVGGLGGAFRHVPARVLTLAELGCPEVLWRLADKRSGLLLVTGPVGEGKSTTVAAMMDHVNKTRACHVLTVEDPIEFLHEPLRAQITHREVGAHVPTLAVAMRNASRENPDVVLVGELRSGDAIRAALDLASSGILVLGTLPTTGVLATLERLLDAFPPEKHARIRALLADTLVGVVGQQLVKAADGKARIAVHEVLSATPAAAAAIREGQLGQLVSIMNQNQAQGMTTFDVALERLLSASKISPETALDRCVDRDSFARIVARVRPDLVDVTAERF